MAISSSVTKFRSLLTKISDSNTELTKMPIESEWKIRDHCDSLRQNVDIAREIAIENLHKAANTLMSEIDAYKRKCLSSWRATKEFIEYVVEDASKRMSPFLAEQHAFLQSVQASDTELIITISL